MSKKILYLAILSAISTMSFAQDTSIPKFNQDFKVSAVVDAGCFLTAENINFSILAMPLQDQSAQSNMEIHCSKGANLNISIEYMTTDGVFQNNSITYKYDKYAPNISIAQIYRDEINIGSIECNTNGLMLVKGQLVKMLGVSSYVTESLPKVCSGNTFNIETIMSLGSPVGGVLSGISQGEQIKYALEVPNSSNVWSSSSKYQTVGTGLKQIIPMKANIKRAENLTHRMTPDTYQSTLNIVLTY